MAYVYKITNDVNDKIYVGKTMFSLQKRFAEHVADSKRDRNENRPLYRAMQKYGADHFHISLIEEVKSPLEAEFSEAYWIDCLGAYKHGYNATKGGDGKSYLDYDYIYNTWEENGECSITALAKKIGMVGKESYLSKIIRAKGGEPKDSSTLARLINGKPVVQLNKHTSEKIAEYESARQAGEALTGKSGTHHIEEVCNRKRLSALGYLWIWKTEYDCCLNENEEST